MSFLVKQAQNLLTQSDTCSGWAGTASLQAGGGSPWGASFILTDSANNTWHLASLVAINTSQNSGDTYGVRLLFKAPQVSSAAVAFKAVLSANGSEHVQASWCPSSPTAEPYKYAVGSCAWQFLRQYEISSPWFALEGSILRGSSSGSLFQFQLFPAVGSTNLIFFSGSVTNAQEWAAVQLVRNGLPGPYVATTTSAVSATPDYVDLNISAYSVGKSYLEGKHRSSSGAMTRQVHGTFGIASASDKFVSRADALKINCWWQNNVALSLQNPDTGHVTSGFLVNKASPVKGLAEPYSDQYEVSIEMEGY